MFSCLKTGNEYTRGALGSYQEFVCDTTNDVDALPTGRDGGSLTRPSPGSTAYVIETGEYYILTNTRAWVKRK